MGGDGLDARVFATVEPQCWHDGPAWWLSLSRCSACDQAWVIAQEERIYDVYLMRRIGEDEAQAILAGVWPGDLMTYESVLRRARAATPPPVFLDPFAGSLQWTVADLRMERADIGPHEIADLLGLSPRHARSLYWNVRLFGTRSRHG